MEEKPTSDREVGLPGRPAHSPDGAGTLSDERAARIRVWVRSGTYNAPAIVDATVRAIASGNDD
jgi:hypothetical protein